MNTHPNAPATVNFQSAVKDTARKLLQIHNAMVLAYTNDYDAVKYQFVAPVTEAQFETHKLKWNFVELAKFFITAKAKPEQLIQQADFRVFCNMMYGEGYREPGLYKIDWIHELRMDHALHNIYRAYLDEGRSRYTILEQSLWKMRATHDIQTLTDFKEFISPIITPKGQIIEPPMWNSIGYSPVFRANKTYTLSIQSFFLLDSVLHLLDKWDSRLQGEPQWDEHAKRLKVYRKNYTYFFPINSMMVRQAVNTTMKFPKVL